MVWVEKTTLPGFPNQHNGHQLKYYALQNPNSGLEVIVANFGATVLKIIAPDKDGFLDNILMGFDSFEEYLIDTSYHGRTIGRWANRISGHSFALPLELGGGRYELNSNEGINTLHGGEGGWSNKIWDVMGQPVSNGTSATVTFGLESKTGDMGFPGTVNAVVAVSLTENDELKFTYTATTVEPTPVNMTFHGYFNLEGITGGKNVLSHILSSNADRHVVFIKGKQIPKGPIEYADGTNFDFREPIRIGQRNNGNYDDCLVFPSGEAGKVRLYSPKTGRIIEMATTEPSVQIYSGIHLGHGGIALEAGKPVNSLNMPQWDANGQGFYSTSFITTNSPYSQQTVYSFGVKK